jgi:hypothetical protein
MSIALNARIKELELAVVVLRECAKRQAEKHTDDVALLLARIQALENRPKPGRPPKEQP